MSMENSPTEQVSELSELQKQLLQEQREQRNRLYGGIGYSALDDESTSYVLGEN